MLVANENIHPHGPWCYGESEKRTGTGQHLGKAVSIAHAFSQTGKTRLHAEGYLV